MSAKVTCPHCNGGIKIESSLLGQVVSCPHCNGHVRMPQAAEAKPPRVAAAKPPIAKRLPPVASSPVGMHEGSEPDNRGKHAITASQLVLGAFGVLFMSCCGCPMILGIINTPTVAEREEADRKQELERIRVDAEIDAEIAKKQKEAKLAVERMTETDWYKKLRAQAERGEFNHSEALSQFMFREFPEAKTEFESLAKQKEMIELHAINERAFKKRREAEQHERDLKDFKFGMNAVRRKSIYYQLVELEDKFGYNTSHYNLERKFLEGQNHLTRAQATEIIVEGNASNWLMPIKR